MKKKLIVLSGLVMGLAPVVAFAQAFDSTCGDYGAPGVGGNIGNILCTIGRILNSLIPLFVILGLVYFVWGVISYVVASDEEAKTTGRDRMIYGIIGLAVIVAVWGLVNILINTFGLKSGNDIKSVPTVVIP